MGRDKFSTAMFCDFCGRGANEVGNLIASRPPVRHICDGCVALFAASDTTSHIHSGAIAALSALSRLSSAAGASRAENAFASELFFASNRAWFEIRNALDRASADGKGKAHG